MSSQVTASVLKGKYLEALTINHFTTLNYYKSMMCIKKIFICGIEHIFSGLMGHVGTLLQLCMSWRHFRRNHALMGKINERKELTNMIFPCQSGI